MRNKVSFDKPEPIILIDQPMVCGAACARPDIPKKILLNKRQVDFPSFDTRSYVCILLYQREYRTKGITMLVFFIITKGTGRKALPIRAGLFL